ncbi:ShlB/FhaC/HecB family hemolysin secretion/activation protein [Sphingomonas piscis]|uniref:ShlB/FhaC/HecB family hemolysin secretion/activation protein n=1 Tax=Sphingomonas piscis TaxID=2714943 RepID=A0A6G7YMZ4_9SPHN|nr:ShlB/FhaC/HecB family hemolysin secretion/activation protein [Sphingomonas piscis]QIK78113.1 ShlB/FhaC/HecB family hemolysin secretion/activation protein [Sphingomonas piscis]
MALSILLAAAVLQQLPTGGAGITRERLDQRPPAPVVRKPGPSGQTKVETVGNGQPIAGIAFRGAQAPVNVAAAAEAFVGRPINRDTLVELAGALSRAYKKSDVALYTISVPDQPFEKNVVVVQLAEGSIGSVDVRSNKGRPVPLLQKQAARLVGQQPLEKAAMQRQFSLMRAIPGLSFDTQFDNSGSNDALKLIVNAKQKHAQLVTGIGNRGPDLAGDLLAQARLSFYGLATHGDHLSFTAMNSAKIRRYRQLGASYSVPIGADGLTLSSNAAWVRTRASRFNIEGTAKLVSVALTYPVIRTYEQAADVSLGVDGVNSENAAFGNVIATEQTRAARLSGGFVTATPKRTISASAIASHGLDILNARVISPLAKANFRKVNGNIGVDQKVETRFSGRATLTGQYSPDPLPGAELFAVGGATVGRAFDTSFLTGDSGVGGVLELAYQPLGKGDLTKSEIYAFGDAARLSYHRRGPLPSQRFDLASAGAGVRLRYKELVELGLEGARVIDRPYPGYDGKWRLSLYYNLSL